MSFVLALLILWVKFYSSVWVKDTHAKYFTQQVSALHMFLCKMFYSNFELAAITSSSKTQIYHKKEKENSSYKHL